VAVSTATDNENYLYATPQFHFEKL